MAQTLTYTIGADRRSLVADAQDFHIDFSGNYGNWVQARQYENSMRQVFVNVKNEDGTPFNLTGCNVMFEGILPDKTHRILDNEHAVMLDAVNGKFRFDFPAQAFAIAGSYQQAFFRVYKDGNSVTTLEFKLEVLADKVISGIIPRDYISPLEDVVNQAYKLRDDLTSSFTSTKENLANDYDKTTNDLKKNFSDVVEKLDDDERSNLANFKKLVTDKVDEVNDLIRVLNNSNQSTLNELSAAKTSLQALEDKIKLDGLFTVSEADEFKKSINTVVNGINSDFNKLKSGINDSLASVNKGTELPNVDLSDVSFVNNLNKFGLPVIYLDHDDLLSLKSKADGKISGVQFKMGSISKALDSIKVQGASSQRYPKKNYTLKFDDDVILNNSWGMHKKYTLKADWVDFSHMRNEFGAFLWRKIRESRINENVAVFVDNNGNNLVRTAESTLSGEIRQKYAMGLNLGAIDSMQVLVVINGTYHGLYSLTVPKDDWMAGMGHGSHEAIVSADTHSLATNFKQHAALDSNGNIAGDDFSVEYVTDEDNQTWVANSINSLIDSVISDSDVESHLDVDSAIDYLILNLINANADGIDKNWILDTWDGTKWVFAAYDMDGTLGNAWDGKSVVSPDLWNLSNHTSNAVLQQFKERWQVLRDGLFSNSNLYTLAYNFAIQIPEEILDYERKVWIDVPGTRTNNIEQITSWLPMRLNLIDDQIKSLS
ncbi:MAG: BppU family phage baseplate upper protein [Limosilactobacillus sp.]|nr:BppU family phage baseplate upper protein [Limosilactobacillus sp.]